MRSLFVALIVLSAAVVTLAQGEQSPIVEKNVEYKDWVYKNVQTGLDMNLRKFTFGKRLVMVAYFSPWCPNWKNNARFVESMYSKYKDKGFDVIGVSEYDTVDATKQHIAEYKLTFPVVSESELKTARLTTSHYELRTAVGDTRKWGSPWYVFLDVARVEPAGLVFTRKTTLVNGELINTEVEKFIRERLGSPTAKTKSAVLQKEKIEVCDPAEAKTSALVKP